MPVAPPVSESRELSSIQPNVVTPALGFRLLKLGAFLLLLSACFGKPLYDLVRYAASNKGELYSHIFLVPVISLYLAWQKRRSLPSLPLLPSVRYAAFPMLLGLAALAAYLLFGREWRLNNYLSITIFAYVCLFIGGAMLFLGRNVSRQLAFPLAFLVFLAPFPTFVEHGIEMFFQHTSAAAAQAMFTLTGTPLFRDGMGFHLPGVALRVAQECSGIRSSFVLFLTSLIAGYMFFHTPWKRAVLALAVIPLGIIRNGFRIVTIGLLCVHVDPAMIDSWIHHHGGPVFFALSLIPFFGLLLWLWRSERKRTRGEHH